ncbi:unnamed protein product, partial [Hydatigera taeniaeformis]|uniref:Uma2 domain-containing protein n=1 Tax=Hydatigena taeniaeformis TaxID=6205 RepID=A0A0R3WYC2_HYDTA
MNAPGNGSGLLRLPLFKLNFLVAYASATMRKQWRNMSGTRSELMVRESGFTTDSLGCSSSQLSLAPMNEPFDSSTSDVGDASSKSHSDLPPVAVRYIGDLPTRTDCKSNTEPYPPTIFVIDADGRMFERYRWEVEAGAGMPFFAGQEMQNRRYRRIIARCDAWLAKSTQ